MNRLIQFVISLVVAFSPILLQAQCGSITLSTQQEINDFFINHPGCDTITTLKIKGNDIVSLQGLDGITYVNSLLITSNPLLQNLHGLESLQHIELDCSISNNATLLSTGGLQNAKGIKGWLTVDNNPMLTDLSGLAGMESAELVSISDNDQLVTMVGMENFKQAIPAGSSNLFTIERNPLLVNMQGLNGLEGGFYLQIDHNDGLLSMDGFDHLVYSKGITLHNNPLLTDLKGLHNMTGCNEYISIQFANSLQTLEGLEKIAETNLSLINNQKLVSLKGLENLHLGWGLEIINNPMLVSLTALSNLTYLQDCNIHDNPILSLCSIPFFCELSFPFPANYSIYNNGGSCTPGNIIFGCNQNFSTAEGRIFIDLDCNQSFDAEDAGVPYHLIDIGTPPHHWWNTNDQGFYFCTLPPGQVNSLSASPIIHFTSVPLHQDVTTGNQYQGYNGINFAFCPDTLFHDIAVNQSHYQAYRPGFTTKAQVCVENIGVYAEEVSLQFEIIDSPASAYVTIEDADEGVINGHVVIWDLASLPIFNPHCFTVIMKVDPQAPIHELITTLISAHVDNVIEIDDGNNTDQYEEKIRGSYDPNEKVVDRDRVEVSPPGHSLDYTIRFQNTGNFPATFIEILDTLENNLETSTFRMIDASHAYQVTFPDSNIVRWRFDNIELPDSLTDENNSHGFIHYSIQTKENLPAETTIANRASIYFDFNTPVITEDAITQVLFPDGVDNQEGLLFDILLKPNPANDEVTVSFTVVNTMKARLEVMSLDGTIWLQKELSQFDAGELAVKISLQEIPTGCYLIRFMSDQHVGLKKLVIQK